MLRDKNLIPLSHQHQHALALCVRIDRASPVPESDLHVWQMEVVHHFQSEIGIHFSAEENVLFPVTRGFEELRPLVEDLLADHAVLRADFARAEAGRMSSKDLSAFARRLSAHIRKEERELFESLQHGMSPAQLAEIGKQLQDALAEAANHCILPQETTKLRPKK